MEISLVSDFLVILVSARPEKEEPKKSPELVLVEITDHESLSSQSIVSNDGVDNLLNTRPCPTSDEDEEVSAKNKRMKLDEDETSENEVEPVSTVRSDMPTIPLSK